VYIGGCILSIATGGTIYMSLLNATNQTATHTADGIYSAEGHFLGADGGVECAIPPSHLAISRLFSARRGSSSAEEFLKLVREFPPGPSRDFGLMVEINKLSEDAAFLPNGEGRFATGDGLQKFQVISSLTALIDEPGLRGAILARQAQRRENFSLSFPVDYPATPESLFQAAKRDILTSIEVNQAGKYGTLAMLLGTLTTLGGFILTAVGGGVFSAFGEKVLDASIKKYSGSVPDGGQSSQSA
jgi:hypothetical protein